MKILVPTDFSRSSKIAAVYGAHLAKKLKAELILLNTVVIEKPSRATAHLTTNEIVQMLSDHAANNCITLIGEIKSQVKGKIKISYAIENGRPVKEVVDSFATMHGVELIVIGTKGASGLKKILLGNNAAALISNSRVPVLTVPEFASFSGLKDLVYATNMNDLYDEIKILLPLARIFDTTIHIIHVIQAGSEIRMDETQMTGSLKKKLKYPKIECRYLKNKDVNKGIGNYLAKNKADILAMFSGKKTFLEKMFGKSITRRMAYQTRIPLLTFKK